MIITQKSAIGAAPGKLDFLGGIGNLNQSLSLQVQTESKTTVLATSSASANLSLSSTYKGKFSTEIDAFTMLCHENATMEDLRNWLTQCASPDWTHYIIGSLFVFCNKFQWQPIEGLSFAVSSDIPMQLGASSSIALEIATFRSLEKLSGCYFSENELAHAAQKVENELLLRNCPLENPLTAAFGKPGCLLPVERKTNHLRTAIELPKGIGLAACSFNSETNDDFANISTASIMGSRIISTLKDHKNEYTSPLPPSFFHRHLKSFLPSELSGSEYLKSYGELPDSPAKILPDTLYRIRSATEYTVSENNRTQMAAHMLSSMVHNAKRKSIEFVGELMLQSYSQGRQVGLGSPKTDKAIEALVALGSKNGIYGARINGGPKDNSLVVLLERSSVRYVKEALDNTFSDPNDSVTIIQ